MRITKISDEIIKFDNGFILMYYHEQECCELVYADFENLKNYNLSTVTGKKVNIYNIDFEEDIDKLIERVAGLGFNMVSKIGDKFFIPCYNEQNGFYGDNLELILGKTIDITNCKKNYIEE